ncbi:MAG TPA: Uma2 family endonuclease [Thermoanaerobaculia bacterium]|nr:Uma2 family endonuclease [Thermoanaerobaculia bacterium]
MSPQSPQHAGLTDQLAEVLTECFGQGYRVRLHSPISCGPEDLPEPDIAVVEGARGSFRSRHPEGKELALLVEISSSSRRKDHRKAGLYARWGVDHYWLIDLEQQRLEVHTEPRADGGYGLVHILDPGQRVEVPGTGTELDVSAVLGL